MIKLSMIFASFGLVGLGYYIATNSLAGQISCSIMAIGGYMGAIAWYELDKYEENNKNDRASKKRI